MSSRQVSKELKSLPIADLAHRRLAFCIEYEDVRRTSFLSSFASKQDVRRLVPNSNELPSGSMRTPTYRRQAVRNSTASDLKPAQLIHTANQDVRRVRRTPTYCLQAVCELHRKQFEMDTPHVHSQPGCSTHASNSNVLPSGSMRTPSQTV